MIRLAFVHSGAIDSREIDLLSPVLGVAGFQVDAVRWDDATVAWNQFEALFIREVPLGSESILRFADWMNDASKVAPMFNAPEMISWNIDRSYLFEYRERGVKTPEIALGRSVEDARRKLASFSADQVWVRTRSMWGIDHGPLPARNTETLVSVKNMLDFSDGVLIEGDLGENELQRVTFATLNGRLSHAVCRKDSPDGTVVYEPHSPSEALVLAADYALQVSFDIWESKDFSDFSRVPLYGNLELAVVDGEPLLLGVDFIHPNLFLYLHPYAIAKFFNAFLRQRNGFMGVSL